MTDTTPPDWVLIEAAKRGEWSRKEQEPGFGKNQYHVSPLFRALCDMIEKYEQPPVDRKLLCAREAMAENADAVTPNTRESAKFRSGKYDRTYHVTVPLRAIELWKEGFGE
jgi:hypothetical protein